MRKFILTTLAILPLAACSHTYDSYKAGVTPNQHQMDINECEYESQVAVAGQENPLIASSMQGNILVKCMQNKGYAVKEQ